MIKRLYIEDFLLIKDVSLDFCPGLNVISGETGTGKSMTLSTVAFVAGRQGDYPEGTSVEIELQIEEREVVLRREIRGGRSRYFLNGRGTTKAVVQEILSKSVILQGQNDATKLLREDYQREVIDTFGSLTASLEEVGSLYELYSRRSKELKRGLEELERLRNQKDYLEFQVKEVEEVGVSAEEVEELRKKAELFKHKERLAKAVSKAAELIFWRDDSALSLVGKAVKELLKASELDSSLREPLGKLIQVKELLEEVQSQVEPTRYELSASEIDEINEKLYKVQRLEDKYKKSFSDILEYVAQLKKRLKSLDTYEERIDRLRESVEEAKREFYEAARRLSEGRKRAAGRLEVQIREILKELNLEKAKLKVEFREGEPSRYGLDRIEFLFSSYGKGLKPLEEVASGGELSRLFLALTLLQPTSGAYIFDEIDIGISGEASLKMAKLLRKVAESMQVIVITHSSSVCAAAHRNFMTEKEYIGDMPLVRVKELSQEEKVREVARLMGARTRSTLEGAKELIDMVIS